MTTKSDFAQKLLHDLRLRKERMAAAQHSNGSSSMASRGSYGNPGQGYKGSRQTKSLESVGVRSGNSSIRPRSGAKSFQIEDTSTQQLVPYVKGTSSRQIGDVSTSLAFTFPNGGKVKKIDASGSIQVLNFLQHIGRRSVDTGSIEIRSKFGRNSSNSHVFTFSQVHINEISKGIQKLNQILRGCSVGINVDRYSTEVGKELLKGAMDLEQSLRMLVNLEEASNYMINTQGKTKIKLLEDDEDEGSENAKLTALKQIEPPRFSFDKPSKNSRHAKQAAKNVIKQQPLALTYPQETRRLQEKQHQSIPDSAIHSRSTSCIPVYKTISAQLEWKSEPVSSHLQPQKSRPSNVIAKLMGLEELPPKEDSKATRKVMSSQTVEAVASKKDASFTDLQPQNRKSKPPITKSKDAVRSLTTNPGSTFTMKAQKTTLLPVRGNSTGLIAEDESYLQEFRVASRISAGSVAIVPAFTVDKQQEIRTIQPNEKPVFREIRQETGKDNDEKDKENKIKKTAKIEDLQLEEQIQHKMPLRLHASEAEHVSKSSKIKEDTVKTGNKPAGSLHLSRQAKHPNLQSLQQERMIRKSDNVEEKRNLQHPKQKLPTGEPKGSQEGKIVTSKPKSSPRVSEKKQASKTLATAGKKTPVKQLEAKGLKIPSNKRNDVDSATGETGKANEMKISKHQIHRKVDAVVNRRNIALNHLARLSKPQSQVCQQMEQQNDRRTSNSDLAKQVNNPQISEGSFTESSKQEVSSKTSKEAELSWNVAEDLTLYNPGMETDRDFSNSPTANHNSINIAEEAPEVTHDCQPSHRLSVCADDLLNESSKSLSRQHRGDYEVKAATNNAVKNEHRKNSRSCSADPLTESEKKIKEILIKGQSFLNTAEALFKLNIPVTMLHCPDPSDQESDTKLLLDCGTELLKKKGRRRELMRYPFKEMSFVCVVFKSFDDLIKILNDDFCKLKSYSGKWDEERDTADYLYQMLEKDVYNKDPDVNGMWDFGWHEKAFAFFEKDEVIKDVEKHMLNGLLNEVTRDLLHKNLNCDCSVSVECSVIGRKDFSNQRIF